MATQESHALACLEVWGGNRRVAQSLTLPGLAGWIWSDPLPGSPAGGDVYYLTLCSRGELTRVGVADVSGHGATVSRAAERLRELMRKHINAFDQTELARELNQAFEQEAPRGKFATVLLLGVYRATGELVFTNAGHPSPLWYRAARRMWTLLEEAAPEAEATIADLPLGLIPGTHYHQFAARLEPGDLVLVYSDALSEARNPAGEMLQPQGLLRLAQQLPVDSPAAAGQALLKAVEQFRARRPVQDDQTVVALQKLAA